jgi:hypothetical protein
MEANNVGAMSRIAAIGLGEQGFYSSSDLNDGEKKAASHNTLPIEAGIELELKDEPESEQPTGLMRMEAITQVWTKKWLVAAYALYVTSPHTVTATLTEFSIASRSSRLSTRCSSRPTSRGRPMSLARSKSMV